MPSRLYTKDHTWIVAEGKKARVGISDFAQKELGDIAYVDLPPVGRRVARGDVACTVDSLKSSSEIYSPVAGTIVEVNTVLSDEEHCALINRDPLGEGWLFVVEMSAPAEMDALLSEKDYAAYIGGE
ncbi:MAG TPA: glycine cleavage system protein GcvH [Spirochaetia bacterium]